MMTGTAERPDGDVAAREALSAWFDGEPSEARASQPLDNAPQDWAIYGLIGDAMRDPRLLQPVSAAFGARMSAALAREQSHAVPAGASKAPSRRSVRPAWLTWPSMAVAAAVASVVWVAQPLLEPDEAQTNPVALADTASLDPALVHDYTDAHRHVSGPIAVRQAMHLPGADR